MSELVLTPDQRRQTEQRILHDAELIREGAVINHLGILVVTESQYLRLRDQEKYDPEIHEWLDTDIVTAFEESGLDGPRDRRPITTLQRQKVTQIRQVLALGRQGTRLGEKGQRVIDALLANDYGLEWLYWPKSGDVAGYCRSLDEVPGQVVHGRVKAGLSLQDILSRLDEPDESFSTAANYAVRGQGELSAENKTTVLQQIRVSAVTFSEEFLEARRQF